MKPKLFLLGFIERKMEITYQWGFQKKGVAHLEDPDTSLEINKREPPFEATHRRLEHGFDGGLDASPS
jgi:hypothetical protein